MIAVPEPNLPFLREEPLQSRDRLRTELTAHGVEAMFLKPTWMDVPPVIYSGNPLITTQGMVFFVHIMIPDTTTGMTAGVGQSFAITDGIPEVFCDLPVQLYCC